jgi:citrate synthase
LNQLKEAQMNRDELITEVLTTTAATTKPAKLVLTKAEILAALAPIENIAKSIEANELAYLAWYETLPTKDGDDDEEQIVDSQTLILNFLTGSAASGLGPTTTALWTS